jgi:hypothetical protein
MQKSNEKRRVELDGMATAIDLTAAAKREALPGASAANMRLSVATQPTGFQPVVV